MAAPDASADPSLVRAQPALRMGRTAARIRQGAGQAVIVGLVLALVIGLGAAIHRSLAKQGITFSFGFLSRPSGIGISEGVELSFDGGLPAIGSVGAASSNAQVLLAGLLNTLKVAALAMAFSTVLGMGLGVGRLSTNWLIRNLAFGLVEFVRNTPLLIQLVFWYFAVILRFPPVSAASDAYASVLFSQSGVFMPGLALSDTAATASVLALGAGVAALVAAPALRRWPRAWRLALAACGLAGVAMSALLGFPLVPDYPVVGRFGASGGVGITPEMSAILLAITVNSGAYTAEIVRGAIEAIPKGQWEASAALGLSRRDSLRDVVLPQVFRIVLPSLGNRYISLTKDTSLGIAIGFPDLFNVYGTVANQTGRNLEGVVIVMLTSLLVSWVISGAVNLANARVFRQGARA